MTKLYLKIEEERRIFNNDLIRFLNRKKKLLEIKEDTLEKVKRQDKLNSSEFWKVFELLQQEGPKVKYSNPDSWSNISRN